MMRPATLARIDLGAAEACPGTGATTRGTVGVGTSDANSAVAAGTAIVTGTTGAVNTSGAGFGTVPVDGLFAGGAGVKFAAGCSSVLSTGKAKSDGI